MSRIELRQFRLCDLERMDLNEFSKPDAYIMLNRKIEKFTLLEGEPKAILCFIERRPRVFSIFVLLSKNLSSSICKKIKKTLEECACNFRAKLAWTASVAENEMLERWHEFLGFKKRKKITFSGKDFYIWVKSYGS